MKRATTAALALIAWLLLPETGNCFYNPSTGRWISRDPLGESGGSNLYRFLKSPLDEYDHLGLCTCCECAEDVDLRVVDLVDPTRGSEQLGSYFVVTLYLSYKDGNGAATLKWEERTNLPSDYDSKLGAQPNKWYDSYALNKADFHNWNDRHRTPCNVGRVVQLGDNPFVAKRLGYKYLQFRITVLNPPNCHCEKPEVQVTADQIIDPQKSPPIILTTPDPAQ